MTSVQLAVVSGVGLSSISLAERTGFLSPAIAKKLARVLGVDAGVLRGEVDADAK